MTIITDLPPELIGKIAEVLVCMKPKGLASCWNFSKALPANSSLQREARRAVLAVLDQNQIRSQYITFHEEFLDFLLSLEPSDESEVWSRITVYVQENLMGINKSDPFHNHKNYVARLREGKARLWEKTRNVLLRMSHLKTLYFSSLSTDKDDPDFGEALGECSFQLENFFWLASPSGVNENECLTKFLRNQRVLRHLQVKGVALPSICADDNNPKRDSVSSSIVWPQLESVVCSINSFVKIAGQRHIIALQITAWEMPNTPPDIYNAALHNLLYLRVPTFSHHYARLTQELGMNIEVLEINAVNNLLPENIYIEEVDFSNLKAIRLLAFVYDNPQPSSFRGDYIFPLVNIGNLEPVGLKAFNQCRTLECVLYWNARNGNTYWNTRNGNSYWNARNGNSYRNVRNGNWKRPNWPPKDSKRMPTGYISMEMRRPPGTVWWHMYRDSLPERYEPGSS